MSGPELLFSQVFLIQMRRKKIEEIVMRCKEFAHTIYTLGLLPLQA
jgi:hypothetical protein